jgi:hypothetical protein
MIQSATNTITPRTIQVIAVEDMGGSLQASLLGDGV